MSKYVVLLLTLVVPCYGFSADGNLFDLTGSLPELQPDVERKKVEIPRIDEEYFELGASIGSVNVEDFGSHFSYGAQASIHVTQSFFFKLKASRTKASDNVFRRLGLPLFDESGYRTVDQLTMFLGWNVFPGEVYIGDQITLGSNAYLLAGAGELYFGQKEYFGVSIGMGLRILPVDWLSINIEALGTEYKSDIFGFEKVSHNFESSLGINVYF